MKTLYLFRHAKSDWSNPSLGDFDRPLAPRGEKSAPLMGGVMRDRGFVPDMVLCSAAVRARQTWDHAAAAFDASCSVEFTRDLYHAGPGDLLHAIRQADDACASVMLVGHNPGMENLADTLAGRDSDREALALMHRKFPTAALAVLEFEVAGWAEIDAGQGRLTHFLRPRDLA